jgi:hypothetical protein
VSTVVKAPGFYGLAGLPAVFLAGSIEMGKAVDWQTKVTEALTAIPCLVLNPRRSDWDSSWKQEIGNAQFNEQVSWELKGMEDAKVVAVYFDPATKSPITLMELGIWAGRQPAKLVVCCPEGFWRKGNVDIVCNRYHVQQVGTVEELISAIKAKLR